VFYFILEVVVKSKFYPYKEFVEVCRRLKVVSRKDYAIKYKVDPKLPGDPVKIYKNFSWTPITRNKRGAVSRKYYPYHVFLQVCKKLRFTTIRDYHERHKIDPKLPRNAPRIYPGFKFSTITGITPRRREFYTYDEFKEVFKTLQFKNQEDYYSGYKEDPKLPSNPHKIYPGFKFSELTGRSKK